MGVTRERRRKFLSTARRAYAAAADEAFATFAAALGAEGFSDDLHNKRQHLDSCWRLLERLKFLDAMLARDPTDGRITRQPDDRGEFDRGELVANFFQLGRELLEKLN